MKIKKKTWKVEKSGNIDPDFHTDKFDICIENGPTKMFMKAVSNIINLDHYCLNHALALLLLLQAGHLYCLICSARAGVIFTHLPWNHFSHMSQQIQNSSFA